MEKILCDEFLNISIKKIIGRHKSSIFILHGIKGVGKRSFADGLCQKLLDANNKEEFHRSKIFTNNFNNLKHKKLFKNNSHPDFFLLENNENKKIKIDNTRQLKNFLNKTPSISNNKVVIIDPIESLTLNATNSLLKNFEEVKNNVYIFLISHNYIKVLNTIKSRVFKFYFKPLNKNQFLEIINLSNFKNFENEELVLIESLLNFSPGQYIDLVNKNINLLESYKNYLSKIDLIFNSNINKYTENSLKSNDINTDLKIKFTINFFKNLLIYFTSKKFDKKVIKFEREIIKNMNLDDFFVDKLYNELNSFQYTLNVADLFNSSKDELIEIFFKKFN